MSLFLEMEDAIIARLNARFADLTPVPRVYKSSDLAMIKDRSQGDLSVFVAYNGIVGAETAAPNVRHIGAIQQQWMIWVVSRSAKSHGAQAGTRELADPVLERIIESLMGAKLIKDIVQLVITDTVSPAYSDGFGYFPLAFNARKTVRGII